MVNKKNFILILFLVHTVIFLGNRSTIITASPVAAFSASPISGFAPLTVQFTDLSQGTISQWAWDIGDGAVSSEQNPSHVYNSAGIYSVVLTVSDFDGSDTFTKTDLINVFTANVPTASYKASPLSGAAPLLVNFTDLSEPDGAIENWSWRFGDGGVSLEQNPTHIYNSEGFFNVGLTVSNSGGQDSETKNNHIVVSGFGPPISDFSVSLTSGKTPLEVTFTDLSEPNGLIDSWFWEFGDGGTSVEQNPVHIYNSGGFFSVQLTVSFEGGADIETKSNLINVVASSPPIAEFSASPTVGLVELSVDFTDLSEGEIDNWMWNFGDGAISIEKNPNHNYRVAGIFTISLTVSGSGGADSEIKTNLITVMGNEPPTPEFQATPTIGFSPLNVQFSDLSQGLISNWFWDFGDGLTSILQNPFHVYKNPGIYSVTLTVSSSDGATVETKTNLITIEEGDGITSAFVAEPLLGSVPLTVKFSDQTSGNPDNWIWNFGDGGTSSGEANPKHIYESAGIFTVELIVSGNSGISTETKQNYITVVDDNLPTAAFGASIIESGIQIKEVQFEDFSSVVSESSDQNNELGDDNSRENDFEDKNTDEKKIVKTDTDAVETSSVQWNWDFGDGSQSDEQNPAHRFEGKDERAFDITLVITDRRGTHMVSKKSFVGVSSIGPGFIKGTMKHKETREPIADVKAFINGLGLFQRTKSDGNFFFELMPGNYDLCADKDGFKDLCEKGLLIKAFEVLAKEVVLEPLNATPTPTPSNGGNILIEVDIKPDTIDLSSKRKFKAFITLLNGKLATEIDENSVMCEGASAIKTRIDKTGSTMITKFNISDIEGVEIGNSVEFTVSGNLKSGEEFIGADNVEVVD